MGAWIAFFVAYWITSSLAADPPARRLFPSIDPFSSIDRGPFPLTLSTDFSGAAPARKSDLYEKAAEISQKQTTVTAISPAETQAAEAAAAEKSEDMTHSDYDLVSPEYRKGISERLDIARALVERHGRAYDYKSYKTAELRAILSSLDEQDRSQQ